MPYREGTAFIQGTFALANGKTVMTERRQAAPLKISKTHTLPGGTGLYVCMMDCSPGMLDGDAYEYRFLLKPGARVYLTNQSFTKIHPSPFRGATVNMRADLAEGAHLDYMPEPLIPFRNSRYRAHAEFRLTSGASLFYADLLTPGRTARGETFQYLSYASFTDIYVGGELAACDRFAAEPGKDRLQASGAFEHYTHAATVWMIHTSADEALLAAVRQRMDAYSGLLAGASRLAGSTGIAARMLGNTIWELQELTEGLWETFHVWRTGESPVPIRK
jgi:urease accessory protein